MAHGNYCSLNDVGLQCHILMPLPAEVPSSDEHKSCNSCMLPYLMPVHCAAAAKTVNYCNCLPVFNYTASNGVLYSVNNGSCIRTTPSELPWCYVMEDTCITPVLHRPGLGRNDSAWDTCLTTGAFLSSAFPQRCPLQ